MKARTIPQQQKHPRRCSSSKSIILWASAAVLISKSAASALSPQITKPPSPKQHDASKTNQDNDEWDLLIYDDSANTREMVARVLVQVAGRSESEAFCTMNEAHKTGVAVVGSHLRFEIAEFYNEGLRKEGLLSEIVPVSDL